MADQLTIATTADLTLSAGGAPITIADQRPASMTPLVTYDAEGHRSAFGEFTVLVDAITVTTTVRRDDLIRLLEQLRDTPQRSGPGPRIRQVWDNGQVLVPIEELHEAQERARRLEVDLAETERDRRRYRDLDRATAAENARLRSELERKGH